MHCRCRHHRLAQPHLCKSVRTTGQCLVCVCSYHSAVHPANNFVRCSVHSSAAPTCSGSSSATAATTPTTTPSKKQVFAFDQVHSPTATQHALFTSTTLPLISCFLEGFNCTILAYGHTSSGKTFTITGIDLDANPSDPHNSMGIISSISTIFSQAKKLKEEWGPSWNYTIKGSFVEIYNEDLINLLSSDNTGGVRCKVQIREAKYGSIIWGGPQEVIVHSSTEVMK